MILIRPLDPRVAAEVSRMKLACREFFEERVAIIQFDGGIEQFAAEAQALEQTRAWFNGKIFQAGS